jgi:cold shock CspA family protein
MPSHLPSHFVGPVKPACRGEVTKGRIKLLVLGQGSGIISAPSGDVFFHKTDVQGTFWDLKRGDAVVFELLRDAISGPRAQKVRVAAARKSR